MKLGSGPGHVTSMVSLYDSTGPSHHLEEEMDCQRRGAINTHPYLHHRDTDIQATLGQGGFDLGGCAKRAFNLIHGNLEPKVKAGAGV